jgi:aminobenzoyl-glutamate transport protein
MSTATEATSSRTTRFLDKVEVLGNKLPDPAVIFVFGLVMVWIFSWILSGMTFTEINPKTGEVIQITNLVTGEQMTTFLANMVKIFTGFAPLGVVLVAMLGVGVAEHSGFISTGLKIVLKVTPQNWLTPMIILVAIVSHTASDAGYVLVIPLAGIIYYSAGRHPLAGIAAAFAGVSGGFSANFIPSGIDPLLQSFTQVGAQVLDPDVVVNPLGNWFFTSASSVLIIGLGWYLTDKVIEPKLNKANPLDGDLDDLPKMGDITELERKSFNAGLFTMILGCVLLALAVIPGDSAFRAADGAISTYSAPLMQSIVPLIFLLFLMPGVVYGYRSGAFKNTKDLIAAMSKAMEGMSYYIVMAFFCALFIYAFGKSNIGALIAIKGAEGLKALALPAQVTIVGIIILTAFVNLLVGSSSAKWGLLAPIFVPMLMQLGISPELTQAAYRVGDSTSNIVTPLMPYFPLVVVYAQRYVKGTGIGTLLSMMLPYCIVFIVGWTIFLLGYWALGIPLGLDASYTYSPAG